jgi:hypothetical protein
MTGKGFIGLVPGASTIKLFTSVIIVSHFRPSLIFLDKEPTRVEHLMELFSNGGFPYLSAYIIHCCKRQKLPNTLAY